VRGRETDEGTVDGMHVGGRDAVTGWDVEAHRSEGSTSVGEGLQCLGDSLGIVFEGPGEVVPVAAEVDGDGDPVPVGC